MTRIRFHGLLAALALAFATACAPEAPSFIDAPSTSASRLDASSWGSAGTMASVRVDATATLLRNGYVLVAGGGTSAAELYDPRTSRWFSLGAMATSRQRHTATLLASGKVLVVGGGTSVLASAGAELFDPDTNSWSAATGLDLPRTQHTATLLPDGRVLVAGGDSGFGNALS
ncbi:kelch-like protein, partial [Corallococcus sp. AB018]